MPAHSNLSQWGELHELFENYLFVLYGLKDLANTGLHQLPNIDKLVDSPFDNSQKSWSARYVAKSFVLKEKLRDSSHLYEAKNGVYDESVFQFFLTLLRWAFS